MGTRRTPTATLQVAESWSRCVGMPLDQENLVTASLVRGPRPEGPRLEGIRVELSGAGLALLEVEALQGWNDWPSAVLVPLQRQGETLSASFPQAVLEATEMPMLAGESLDALRAFEEALERQTQGQFTCRLRGRASTPGRGEVVLRLTDLQGRELAGARASLPLEVRPAPRLPVLPARAPREGLALVKLLDDARLYGGDDHLWGWIGFDAPWTEIGAWVLDTASRIASVVAGRSVLSAMVVSDGHLTMRAAKFRRGDEIARTEALLPLLRHLEADASVNFEPAVRRAGDHRWMRISHESRGPAFLTPAERAKAASTRPERCVPVALHFGFARPSSPAERASVAALLDRMLEEAADRRGCVGGLVTPTGPGAEPDHPPYEQLVDTRAIFDVEIWKHHTRAPGWRVIVPPVAAARIAEQPGVERSERAACTLLRSSAPDPWAMGVEDREAMERAILPALR